MSVLPTLNLLETSPLAALDPFRARLYLALLVADGPQPQLLSALGGPHGTEESASFPSGHSRLSPAAFTVNQPRLHWRPAQAPPPGPNARTPQGGLSAAAPDSLSHVAGRDTPLAPPPTSVCAVARPSGLGNSAAGCGQPFGSCSRDRQWRRRSGRRRSQGFIMAAAVRAVGCLPTLCGLQAGESRDAGRGALSGVGNLGFPADCRCTGRKERQNLAPGPVMLGSRPFQSRCVTLRASAPSLDRRAL